MLDYQNLPTERLATAGRIAEVLLKNKDFFAGAKPVATPFVILVSLESMTLDIWKPLKDHPGRDVNAHLQAVVGTHLALSQMGITARIKHMDDFAWDAGEGGKQLAFLPHAWAMTTSQADRVARFIKNGNQVMATGNTGMFDQYQNLTVLKNFPLAAAFQGQVKEINWVSPHWELKLDKPKPMTLPAHLWRGGIVNEGGEVLGRDAEGRIVALRSHYGNGEAVWIPSPVCLGAWSKGAGAYAELISKVAAPFVARVPFRFAKPQPAAVLTTLENQGRFVTIIANGTTKPCDVELIAPGKLKSRTLWGEGGFSQTGHKLTLLPRQTAVLLWE